MTLPLQSNAASDRLAVPRVPDSITEPEHSRLIEKAHALQSKLNALDGEIRQHNAHCDPPSNESEDRACTSEDVVISTHESALIADIKAFQQEIDLARSVAPDKPAEKAQIAQVRATGDFYFVMKNGRRVTGATAMNLQMLDQPRIVTGPNARVQIYLPDETVFTVGPDADMVLDAFVYESNPSSSKIVASLAKGLFRWTTGQIARRHPKEMLLRLAVAAVGIRGTDFETMVAPDKSGYIKVHSGAVEFTAATNGAKTTIGAGQMLKFDSTGAFVAPKPLE